MHRLRRFGNKPSSPRVTLSASLVIGGDGPKDVAGLWWHRDSPTFMPSRAVLVTGASTGIGRACALRLDRRGWRVFAGVRNQTAADRLSAEASGALQIVSLDVTDQASIDAATRQLRDELGHAGLQGLVNNAGVSVQGPLEYLELDELRRQLEVNVVGQIAVTQAALPLVRAGRGRIAMMSSIAGRTMSVPLIAPYSASKVALEALGEALRYELLMDGIHVALIEPGSIDTPIWTKGDATVDPIVEALPAEGKQRYMRMIERGRRMGSLQARRGIPPERVARVVERALTVPRPRLRYLVGADAHLRAHAEPLLPQALKDMLVRRMFGM
jgi:NAD(P)-dependent dehydrogenase (short-subunit alcohol dehydrogenase family)